MVWKETRMSGKPMTGKVTLVTGASRGIGRAIALAAAAAGSDIAILARDKEKLKEVGDEARGHGVKVAEISADLSTADAAAHAVEEAQGKLGGVHHLVANAGIAHDQLVMRMKPADWDRVLHTNLTSTFLLCRAALSGMVRARYGRIVFISSVSGLMGNPGQASYAASKAGMIGLAKSLAREVASRSITVNVVAPGLVDTDMVRGMPEKARDALTSNIPLRRLGKPEEVAGAVSFLMGESAAYITGAVINVSGGLYM
jgi:3-oxoacyl-[acyl-carrier protein] reductase